MQDEPVEPMAEDTEAAVEPDAEVPAAADEMIEPEAEQPVPAGPEPTPATGADEPGRNPHEKKLRALAGRTAPYDGPITAITQAWVSRDSRAHAFAARYLDFAVLTDEHLMLCSTGFFSRRPRRRVFLEPFRQLSVVARGPEPYRTVRLVGDFANPLLIELRSDANSIAFARQLLEHTRHGKEAFTSTPSLPAGEVTEDA